MKCSKRIARVLLLAALCSLLHASARSVRWSITTAKGGMEEEDAAEWVDTPPTAEHTALLARALGDASHYLPTVQRPICLLSVFALKVQHVDARRVNYLFQANGRPVETPVSGGFCRDMSVQPLPFEVEVHAESPSAVSSDQDGSELVVAAIRYLD